jgi:hypothetical protein
MVYAAPASQDMFLGNRKLDKGNIWYSDFKPWLDIYREAAVNGLAGNAFFLQDVIVIDFKQHRFGIATPTK